ncbi:hypothetical protein EJB05_56724 [Eragrostis curvula]|uniref:Uncharacterized protein n=1 Tax=Eragrostis curvula TaxID=38414 RepID=A0A5J9SFJ0_9POAL|nr:hypothetical protein EJB05_56724 [Eragrostis curvula]
MWRSFTGVRIRRIPRTYGRLICFTKFAIFMDAALLWMENTIVIAKGSTKPKSVESLLKQVTWKSYLMYMVYSSFV